MIQPLVVLAAVSSAFLVSNQLFGYAIAYRVGYGAFTLMAAMISVTFLWLWAKRATPLAIGMSFGWAGAASVMGWWWLFNSLHEPHWMRDNPMLFVFLSVYFAGAVLHFQVIGRSFGAKPKSYLYPVAASALISLAVNLVI